LVYYPQPARTRSSCQCCTILPSRNGSEGSGSRFRVAKDQNEIGTFSTDCTITPTLSACETARGDNRVALGLAGVAIQVGARSALGTLWLVEDEAAAMLMDSFYRQLQTPGVSRARALQKAQVALLKHPQYGDPFFWAPFLLINNWL
jgi:CHAT domain-containing protein